MPEPSYIELIDKYKRAIENTSLMPDMIVMGKPPDGVDDTLYQQYIQWVAAGCPRPTKESK